MEILNELRSLNPRCWVCNSGFIYYTGVQKPMYPPIEIHQCTNQECLHVYRLESYHTQGGNYFENYAESKNIYEEAIERRKKENRPKPFLIETEEGGKMYIDPMGIFGSKKE